METAALVALGLGAAAIWHQCVWSAVRDPALREDWGWEWSYFVGLLSVILLLLLYFGERDSLLWRVWWSLMQR